MYKVEKAPGGEKCCYFMRSERKRCGKSAEFSRSLVLLDGKIFDTSYYCGEHLRREELEDKWTSKGYSTCEDTIKCPYCGADLGTDEPEDYESLSGEDYECDECGKTFEVDREVSVEYTYTAQRRVKDMPDDWDGESEVDNDDEL